MIRTVIFQRAPHERIAAAFDFTYNNAVIHTENGIQERQIKKTDFRDDAHFDDYVMQFYFECLTRGFTKTQENFEDE